MGNIDWNLVVTSLAAAAAIGSAFAALRSYKISKSLSEICSIFTSSGRDEITIAATSESERVFVLDISILVKRRLFKNSNYPCALLKNVHLSHERAKSGDRLFHTLFERGLVAGESYRFPISELFKIAQNNIICIKGLKIRSLDVSTLVVGSKSELVFNINGQDIKRDLILTKEIINNINGPTRETDFVLRAQNS
ncbi:hypothetical protein AB3A93_002440 [Vibrio parahaemolyticus]|uniref:hypothetical protein n=1 Tax=Vibrio parahaemolyticus TaxID=670 RepID=UPI00047079D5|nr:hypothetical protein [Vibrio parahaemolyticus]EGR2273185.1 hypothetical protein [Vibrio parahaemolyticus]EGU4186716.1 hypothetical protein [Vibrio parahaemolyticus]EHH2480819.1 hypothetical protein [Vibrio parahaemolyticus]EHK2847472.1 hypothetical protein [Vibrio parahaemolyticus]EJB0370388.1 hypothetical protein [Vibrio parahaemolyticus]